MKYIFRTLAVIAVMMVAVLSGCSKDAETVEVQDSAALTTSRAEHDRDVGEPGGEGSGEHSEGRERGEGGEHSEGREGGEGSGEHGGEGEEDGTQYTLNQTYNEIRNGARLILAYHPRTNSFNGTVENTTDNILKLVRFEVHLSNGTELGPTTPADLDPGEKRTVQLTATGKDFDRWSAHPEVGG